MIIFKHIKKIICLIVLSLMLQSADVFAASMPDYIKVGLSQQYQNVKSISFSNSKMHVGIARGHTYDGRGYVSGSNITVSLSASYYVKIANTLSSIEDAQTTAQGYRNSGYQATVLIDGEGIFVALGPYTSSQDAYQKTSGETAQRAVIGGNLLEIKANGSLQLIGDNSNGNIQFSAFDNNGIVKLGDRQYRDRIEISLNGNGTFTPVNVLPFEEYLYSVVPSEMYSTWHIEALKAQAVAARTYAMTKVGKHGTGYDVCDSVHCQAYKGYGNEANSTNTAVDATKGVAIYYQGQPIDAVFYASSGGITEASENVWLTAIPYLKSVSEINETTGRVWSRTFTAYDLDEVLQKQGISIGHVTDLKIVSKSESGRVMELQFIGTNGSYSVKKEEVRTFFSVSKQGSLDSRLFVINEDFSTGQNPVKLYVSGIAETSQRLLSGSVAVAKSGTSYVLTGDSFYVETSTGVTEFKNETLSSGTTGSYAPGVYVLNGRGYGHGVGLSQEGARGMADIGFTYVEILKHYYTGVEVY